MIASCLFTCDDPSNKLKLLKFNDEIRAKLEDISENWNLVSTNLVFTGHSLVTIIYYQIKGREKKRWWQL